MATILVRTPRQRPPIAIRSAPHRLILEALDDRGGQTLSELARPFEFSPELVRAIMLEIATSRVRGEVVRRRLPQSQARRQSGRIVPPRWGYWRRA